MSSKSILSKIIVIFIAAASILSLVFIYRAFVVIKPCKHVDKLDIIDEKAKIKIDSNILNRLQKAIRYQTVSYNFFDQNLKEIQEFDHFIRNEFNDIEQYSFVKCNQINNLSFLYEITGKDKSLKPYLLAAHFDVVPADAKNDKWSFDPFSGQIDQNNEFIYGRGTMDDKASMIAQLEAVRLFLKKFGQPQRTIYLAYGHDEEINGFNGAGRISEYLNNTQLEFVLDEGTMIIDDIFPELKKPFAYISVADKGYLTVKFYVNVTGGHSSMPNSNENSLFILANAITKLKENKVPSRIGYGPEVQLFEQYSIYFGFFKRVLLANLWFFKPIIQYVLSLNPVTDALQRTTTAVTVFNGGHKDNVIPSYAEFIVNHRIHSSQSCAEIIKYDLSVINDERVNYEMITCVEPSSISPTNSLGYSLIKHSVMQLFPNSAQVPSVMVGLTDSRFYYRLTNNIYKFLPIQLKNADLKRYHGVDERISIQNYEDLINFYYVLMTNTDKAHLVKRDEFHQEL